MDVICAGILVADIFSSPIDSLPKAGELKLAERFLCGAGGCAANTAACLRRLGKNVLVAGKVGRDLFGDFVIAELARLGVDSSHIRRSDAHPTSGTFILNVRGEDRRYLHVTGSNAAFTLRDIDRSLLSGSRVLYLGGYLALPGVTPADLRDLFEEAKRSGLITVLDVVIPTQNTVSLDAVETVLPVTDYFLPNEDEALRLTGFADPERQALALARLHPQGTVVITRGGRGSVAASGPALYHTPAFPMESIDESGAGDAFAAGLIAGILEDWPLAKTLRFAGAVGASCTRALGCTAGVFTFEEALSFLDSHPVAQQTAPAKNED